MAERRGAKVDVGHGEVSFLTQYGGLLPRMVRRIVFSVLI